MPTIDSHNEDAHFTITRSDRSIDFVCDKCLKPKTAKTTVQWHSTDTALTKIICIGCYGDLRTG